MTRGLPGSGKSYWAAQQLTTSECPLAVVTKDDIRKQLTATGWKWSKENEKDVIAERDRQISDYLGRGINVISADTNFGKHKNSLKAIAESFGATFFIKDFTRVPLEVCIERDSKRSEGRVGEEVIRKMHKQYIALPDGAPYVPDTSKNPAIICDLDGTLALFAGLRSAYDYGKCANDRVNEPIAGIISIYARAGYSIVYCSGREDWCRNQTEDFLATNKLPKGPLFMRPTNDHRKDYIVKQELFDKHIRSCYNVKFVLDDRSQVVQMWRNMGLTCLQVAEGDF